MTDEECDIENRKLANEYAVRGTDAYLALRLGFMPFGEVEAKKILADALKAGDIRADEIEAMKQKIAAEAKSAMGLPTD